MALKKVLVLTFEYPPKIGSIAHACEKLIKELRTQNIKVDVVTWDDWRAYMDFEDRNGALIHYISAPILPASNTITFFATLNVELERMAASIFHESPIAPDLIHVHEWMTVQAGLSLKSIFNKPLILTLYSLENHRSHGASSPFNESIKAIERKGIQAASKLIVFSKFLKDEIIGIYSSTSEDKICVMNLDEEIGSQTAEIYNEMLENTHSISSL
ncbi:MAG: glycosyltransferase [Candidatus Sifarchaeia archaeon]|jgi:glycosyltransferase involved in cell wall biosynthesis